MLQDQHRKDLEQISRLNAEIDLAGERNSKAQKLSDTEIQAANKKIKELEGNLEEMQKQAQSELQKAKGLVDNLEREKLQIAALLATKDEEMKEAQHQFKSSVQKEKQEKVGLAEQLEKSQTATRATLDENMKLQTMIAQDKTDLDKYREESVQLQSERSELRTAFKELQAKHSETLAASEQTSIKMGGQVAALKEQRDSLQKELEGLKGSLAEEHENQVRILQYLIDSCIVGQALCNGKLMPEAEEHQEIIWITAQNAFKVLADGKRVLVR